MSWIDYFMVCVVGLAAFLIVFICGWALTDPLARNKSPWSPPRPPADPRVPSMPSFLCEGPFNVCGEAKPLPPNLRWMGKT